MYFVTHATSGAFGDFGDLKCLYHIEPAESVSDEVRNIIIIMSTNSLHGYRYNKLIVFIEMEHAVGGFGKESSMFYCIIPGCKDKYMVEPPYNFTTPHNRVSYHRCVYVTCHDWIV